MPADRLEPSASMSSIQLLALARAGDRQALELLCARYLPVMQGWARGRLPRWVRDITDTADIVQDVLLVTLRRVDLIEPSDEAALRPYLHRAVLNRVRDEFRKRRRRLLGAPLESAHPADTPSPFDEAVDAELHERYEEALQRLSDSDRALVVGRLELEMTYEELAAATGRPSPNAARSASVRATLKLADEMRHG